MQKLLDILNLPTDCLANQSLTKAFFKRNFDLLTPDNRLLDDPEMIVKMDIVATIKPENANIAPFNSHLATYEEILVLTIQTTPDNLAKQNQTIAHFIQKFIPYHLLLCMFTDDEFVLNTCDKHINQNDKNKRTLSKAYYTEHLRFSGPTKEQEAFMKSLNFNQLDKTNLKTLYDDYTCRMIALQTTQITGHFTVQRPERSKKEVECLERIEQLKAEIITLQNQAKKETQLNRQVELNTSVQTKRKEITYLTQQITA